MSYTVISVLCYGCKQNFLLKMVRKHNMSKICLTDGKNEMQLSLLCHKFQAVKVISLQIQVMSLHLVTLEIYVAVSNIMLVACIFFHLNGNITVILPL